MCSLCIQHLMSILHTMKDTIWKDTTTYKYIKCPKIYTLWQVNAIVKCHLNLFSMISTFTFWQIITANKVFNTIFHCIFYSSSLLSLFVSTTWWINAYFVAYSIHEHFIYVCINDDVEMYMVAWGGLNFIPVHNKSKKSFIKKIFSYRNFPTTRWPPIIWFYACGDKGPK